MSCPAAAAARRAHHQGLPRGRGGPLVEPRGRGAGDQPVPPAGAGAPGGGAAADRAGLRRGEDARAAGPLPPRPCWAAQPPCTTRLGLACPLPGARAAAQEARARGERAAGLPTAFGRRADDVQTTFGLHSDNIRTTFRLHAECRLHADYRQTTCQAFICVAQPQASTSTHQLQRKQKLNLDDLKSFFS